MSETESGSRGVVLQRAVGGLHDIAQEIGSIGHCLAFAACVVGVRGIEAVAVALPQLEHLVFCEHVVEGDVRVEVLHIYDNPV